MQGTVMVYKTLYKDITNQSRNSCAYNAVAEIFKKVNGSVEVEGQVVTFRQVDKNHYECKQTGEVISVIPVRISHYI